MEPETLLLHLKELVIKGGADFVACADLKGLPPGPRRGMPTGLTIGAALNPAVVAGISKGPTKAYEEEYHRVNAMLQRIGDGCAAFLVEQGFQAIAAKTTQSALDEKTLATPLPHKTVATRAGAGWIGKCALLITKAYGSAVRLNTVLTDAPLPAGTPVDHSRCKTCIECVEACPAGAPTGRDWHPGLERARFFDAFACCEQARALTRKQGIAPTICGICIAACPFTKSYLLREKRKK